MGNCEDGRSLVATCERGRFRVRSGCKRLPKLLDLFARSDIGTHGSGSEEEKLWIERPFVTGVDGFCWDAWF